MKRIFLGLLSCVPLLWAQTQKVFWEQQDYDKIGALFLSAYAQTHQPSEPFIPLGRPLYFSFDAFNGAETTQLRYSIVHCNADFRPSNLAVSNYISGFAENDLYPENLRFSENTRLDYAHYDLQIPNRDIAIKISGFYVLKVYAAQSSEPLIVRRFVVYENQVSLTIKNQRKRVAGHNIDALQVVLQGEQNWNPQRLSVHFLQNGDWSEYRSAKAQLNRRDKAIELLFPRAENEFIADAVFYTFDLSAWQTPSAERLKVLRSNNIWEFYLQNHEALRLLRGSAQGLKTSLNGRYIFTDASGTKAEYLQVFFTMRTLFEQPLYLYGALTNWQIDPRFELKVALSYQNKGYNTQILLKEGLYGYTFVTIDEKGRPKKFDFDDSLIIDNQYRVFVSYENEMENFVRVIALGKM